VPHFFPGVRHRHFERFRKEFALRIFKRLSIFLLPVLALTLTLRADTIPTVIVPDAHTVVLDHFDSSTSGTPYGPLNYQPSLPGFGSAGVFGPGNYVQYGFTPWCNYCIGSNVANQGTLEFWVKFNTLDSILDMNWNNVNYHPGWGHILYQIGPATWDGNVAFFQTWNGERNTLPSAMFGTSPLQTGVWTHLAFSWSTDVSKVYVNGILEATILANVYPDIGGGQNYIYLNNWGDTNFSGLIDEFQLSDIQRTDAEIAAHGSSVPEPGSMILLGSGLLAVAGVIRRKLHN
jgi:hypothetical protein